MDQNNARILIENLLERLELENGRPIGNITTSEVKALQVAIHALRAGKGGENTSLPETKSTDATKLVLSCLDMGAPRPGAQICLDFGTAMSKAALIINGDDVATDAAIEVLSLGVIGEQQEVSETMLISSVYIRNDGNLVFGKAAVDASLAEHANGKRARVDNIKRFLSEDGFDEVMASNFNPTDIAVTGRDLVLAYLAFFSYAVNRCVAEQGLDNDIERRYAMPCFPDPRSTQVSRILRQMLGQAQVLADTFGARFLQGIPLAEFMSAVNAVPTAASNWPMITHHLTEPLGVANVLFDEGADINGTIIVVDVGAGTSDMSLYRVRKKPGGGPGVAVEAKGAARGIPQAGNYLDRLLCSYVLKRAGIANDDPRYRATEGRVQLSIRDNKEALFQHGTVFIPISDEDGVTVSREEFCDLDPVREFSDVLQQCMQEMMDQVPEDWIDVAAQSTAVRVVCTGGGASLPMVQALGAGTMSAQGRTFTRISRDNFPEWMKGIHDSLRAEFPRTAVALGGARKNLIGDMGIANVLAGGVKGTPQLKGYYTKGS